MTTLTSTAIPRRGFKTAYRPQAAVQTLPYSSLAIASIGCIGLFLTYLVMYQTPAFDTIAFAYKAMWSVLFVVIAPALALIFSIIALRRYAAIRDQVRGVALAYTSFVISAVYFVTALAMPLVLLGFYLLYVYIW